MKKLYILFLVVIILFSFVVSVSADVCFSTSKTSSYVTDFNVPSDFDTQVFFDKSSCDLKPAFLVSVNGFDFLYVDGYYYYFAFSNDNYTLLKVYRFSSPLVYLDSQVQPESIVTLFADTYDNGILQGNQSLYDLGIYDLLGIDISFVDSKLYATSNFSLCSYTALIVNPFDSLLNNLFIFVSPDIGILSIWQSIITFIMAEANRITLLSVTAWLFVVGVGGVRKLVTGV